MGQMRLPPFLGGSLLDVKDVAYGVVDGLCEHAIDGTSDRTTADEVWDRVQNIETLGVEQGGTGGGKKVVEKVTGAEKPRLPTTRCRPALSRRGTASIRMRCAGAGVRASNQPPPLLPPNRLSHPNKSRSLDYIGVCLYDIEETAASLSFSWENLGVRQNSIRSKALT